MALLRDGVAKSPCKCGSLAGIHTTGLYRSGVELEMISVILGHSSTQTTRIYATPSVEMIREAMSAATADFPEETAEWETDENELARRKRQK